VVTALALALALVAMELILRYSGTKTVPEQYFFSEAPQHFRDQYREFGYAPFSRNREVAIYSDRAAAWVEYDTSFTVNNAGLVQRKNIDPAKAYIVLVGDSFTQGIGESPWFYELENELPAHPLANLGLVGTGVQHWERALDWFQARVAAVEAVVVIFIASDFSRPYWVARATSDELQFCYEGGCNTILTKLFDGSPLALARYRRELAQSSNPVSPGSSHTGIRSWITDTRTGAMLTAAVRELRGPVPKHLEANRTSLQNLRTRHNVVLVLHLPVKEEATNGAWSGASVELKRYMSELNLPYIDGIERCGLGAADFRPFDPHPNAMGYSKIQKCVSVLLRTFLPKT
jgi:hypothetical protein